VIEHNLDVIKTADWVIDLGPEGGHRGGTVLGEGTPEEIAAMPHSHTGRFLAPLLDPNHVAGTTPSKASTISKAERALPPRKSDTKKVAKKAASNAVPVKKTPAKKPGKTPR
jgi:excinuclease ABC subunit A